MPCGYARSPSGARSSSSLERRSHWMGGGAASWYFLSALAAALASCSSTPEKDPATDPNIVPANYKQEILLTLTRRLEDPTNLSDTYISQPALTGTGATKSL